MRFFILSPLETTEVKYSIWQDIFMFIPNWLKFDILNLPNYVTQSGMNSFFINHNLCIYFLGVLMLISIPVWFILLITNIAPKYKEILTKYLSLGKLVNMQFPTYLSKICYIRLVLLYLFSLPCTMYLYHNPIPLNIADTCNREVRLIIGEYPLHEIILMFWAFFLPADLVMRIFAGIRFGGIRYYRVFYVIATIEWNRYMKVFVIVISTVIRRILVLELLSLTLAGKKGLCFTQIFYYSNKVVNYISVSRLIIAICFSLSFALRYLVKSATESKSSLKLKVFYIRLVKILVVLNKTTLSVRVFMILQSILFLYTHTIPENMIEICDNAVIHLI